MLTPPPSRPTCRSRRRRRSRRRWSTPSPSTCGRTCRARRPSSCTTRWSTSRPRALWTPCSTRPGPPTPRNSRLCSQTASRWSTSSTGEWVAEVAWSGCCCPTVDQLHNGVLLTGDVLLCYRMLSKSFNKQSCVNVRPSGLLDFHALLRGTPPFESVPGLAREVLESSSKIIKNLFFFHFGVSSKFRSPEVIKGKMSPDFALFVYVLFLQTL